MIEVTIRSSVLFKLPAGGSFLGVKKIKDMDNQDRNAIVWLWNDQYRSLRKAHFCVENGEYLGDAFI